MSERAPYSRVYWSILEDAKFDGIREDYRCLGAWLVLLVVADMAWPAPAFLPPAPKASVTALANAGLVDLLPGGRYRIHGLDSERNRRSDAGRNAAAVRWQSERIADPMLDKTRRELDENKPRQAVALSVADSGDRDALDLFYSLTGWKPWGVEFSGDVLKAAINDYTDAKVQAAMQAEWDDNHERRALVKGTLARLAKEADKARDFAKADRKARPKPVVDPAELAYHLGEDIA